ncbi:uncharacterized protein MONBRDRAFT_5806 [Monosiga brevicollis MX1]|uniref:Uncharacterized protein n=1 Tax=Monosiga brevicollis TaxID=81824 RepID=A9USI6_MONBE|nr:uncharacterized protein MONBRDRAFT_5806 [Monosiga brevicollis MX1]EDQ92107.1 predicted protein [Monosiga brevicollis MX1]|eukprot:XP_001743393.1 hypothetical protein [Monosiga brevicollis MX1]
MASPEVEDDIFMPSPRDMYRSFCSELGEFGLIELQHVLDAYGVVMEEPTQVAAMLAQLDVDGARQRSNVTSDSTSVEGGTDRLEQLLRQLQQSGINSGLVRELQELTFGEFERLQNQASANLNGARAELERIYRVNESLTQECQRMESELNDQLAQQKATRTALQESQRLEHKLQDLEAESTRQGQTEQELRATISELETRLAETVERARQMEQELSATTDQLNLTCQESTLLHVELDQLRDAHVTLSHEHQLLTRRHSEGHERLRSLDATASSHQHEVVSLQEQVHELQEAIAMRDTEMINLREELQDAKMTLSSMALGEEGITKGSVLNEIEDLVMSQLKEETKDNDALTVSMLQQLLPHLQETRLASQNGSLVAQSIYKPTDTRAGQVTANPGVPNSLAHVAAAIHSNSDTNGSVFEDRSPSPSVIRERIITPSVDPPIVTGSAQQMTEAPETALPEEVSAVPAPFTNAIPPLADAVLSAQADEATNRVEDKLNQVLRLYAASTQHLVGVKIVTPASAANMSVPELRQLRQTLKDLVAARNKLLLRTLGERETYRNEIHLKKTVLKPVIDMVLATDMDTHPTKSTRTTPQLSSRRSSPGPLGSSPSNAALLQRSRSTSFFGSWSRRSSISGPAHGVGASPPSAPASTPRGAAGKRMLSSLGRLWSTSSTPNKSPSGSEVTV